MTTLQVLSVLFATAALFGMLSRRWLGLPVTIGTMLLTVITSVVLASARTLAPGLHAWASDFAHQIDFQSIILHGMLPLLLFAGAFLLDIEQLAREKLAVSILAVAGTLISTFAVAGLMDLLAGSQLSWLQCLVFGALISPTDPIAVLEMLRRAGVSRPIRAQLAGESLFNDGIGAVLFIGMLQLAEGGTSAPLHLAWLLFLKSGGAVLLAVAAAWLASSLMHRVEACQVDILFTIALALGGYVLAEFLHLSGPLEAVVAGIALRVFNRRQPSPRIAHQQIDQFWEVIDEIQNSVLFVLLGLETLVIPIDWANLRNGITAIFSVNLVRFVAVAAILLLVRAVRRDHKSSVFVLTWGGLRGGLSIALALSVPEAMGRSWMLSATYLVVVFSILLQGASMNWLLHRLQHRKMPA